MIEKQKKSVDNYLKPVIKVEVIDSMNCSRANNMSHDFLT
jgi:hypothetical protein